MTEPRPKPSSVAIFGVSLSPWMWMIVVCAVHALLLWIMSRPKDESILIFTVGTMFLAAIFFGWLGGQSNRTTVTIEGVLLFTMSTFFVLKLQLGGFQWAYQARSFELCYAVFLCFLGLLSEASTRNHIQKAEARLLRYCAHCGYDLTANVTGICPECSSPIPKETREALTKSSSSTDTTPS